MDFSFYIVYQAKLSDLEKKIRSSDAKVYLVEFCLVNGVSLPKSDMVSLLFLGSSLY